MSQPHPKIWNARVRAVVILLTNNVRYEPEAATDYPKDVRRSAIYRPICPQLSIPDPNFASRRSFPALADRQSHNYTH